MKLQQVFIWMLAGFASMGGGASLAHADTVTVAFTDKAGAGSTPGVTASFTLNGDATVSASVTSFNGALIAFGFESGGVHDLSHDFSDPLSTTDLGPFSTLSFGSFDSGWFDTSEAVTAMTWTIDLPNSGPPITFVSQAFSTNDLGFGFYAVNLDGAGLSPTEWAGNLVTPVPEPGTSWLMLVGLAALVRVVRRHAARPPECDMDAMGPLRLAGGRELAQRTC